MESPTELRIHQRRKQKLLWNAGESWAGVRVLLLDVLQKATHYWIAGKGEEEEVQNFSDGMSNLQGTYLQRVLERGVR